MVPFTSDLIAVLTGAGVASFVLGYALGGAMARSAARALSAPEPLKPLGNLIDDLQKSPPTMSEPVGSRSDAFKRERERERTPSDLGSESQRMTLPAGVGRARPHPSALPAGLDLPDTRRYDKAPPPTGKFIPSGPTGMGDFDGWKDKKLVNELQDENTELTNLFTLLPGLTKRITEVTKKRDLAPLLADMCVRLCIPPPEKVMVFFVSKNRRELVLAAKIGYREDEVPSNLKLPLDCGRIGRSIKKMLPLDIKDFDREQRQEPIPTTDFYWKTEIAAPMMHQKEVVGVLSAEGFINYNKHAKKMIAVSANLGAMAIANAEFVQTIQRLADSDALTGLYNKRYFFQKLEEEMDKARLSGKPLSIFMFDIDHFKKYNDRNGHPAGDEALKMTGALLNERRREADTAARYGGEEFICILPETPKDGAFSFAESIRKQIEQTGYPHAESQPLGRVTISGGIATYPEDAFSGTGLIEIADACLYKSKEAGRNQLFKK